MKKKLVASAFGLLIGVLALSGVNGIAFAAVQHCPAGSMRGDKVTINPDADASASNVKSIVACNMPADAPAGTSDNLMETVQVIINVVLGLVGLIAVVMLIIGGISFVTSQGDAGKTAKARNTILYGVVGLVIALLAFAIVNFVLQSVFKPAEESASAITTVTVA